MVATQKRRVTDRTKHPPPQIVTKHWIAVVGGLASLVVVLTAFIVSIFWLDSRYEKTIDAQLREAREQTRNSEQDKTIAINSLWSQFGLTQLRSSFIEDQIFNLTQRKTQMDGKFPAADEAMLNRYTTQGIQAASRAESVRRQIDDMSKPQAIPAVPPLPLTPR